MLSRDDCRSVYEFMWTSDKQLVSWLILRIADAKARDYSSNNVREHLVEAVGDSGDDEEPRNPGQESELSWEDIFKELMEDIEYERKSHKSRKSREPEFVLSSYDLARYYVYLGAIGRILCTRVILSLAYAPKYSSTDNVRRHVNNAIDAPSDEDTGRLIGSPLQPPFQRSKMHYRAHQKRINRSISRYCKPAQVPQDQ
jgi:hypothetical protein